MMSSISVLLFLFAFFILAVFVLNLLYKTIVIKNTQEYFIYQARKGKWNYLAFGSAYCRYGIDFEAAGYPSGRNIGYASQFLYYSDILLRQYSNYANYGAYIFIICADLCFAEVGDNLFSPERYYLMVDRKYLGAKWSLRGYVKEVLFPCIFYPRKNLQVINFFIKRILKNNDEDVYFKMHNTLTDSELVHAAVRRCNDWCDQFGLQNTRTNAIPEQLEKNFIQTRSILTNMIQFCIDNKFKPVLVVTPTSHYLNSLLSKDFLNKVLFDNIKKANVQGIPFFNYLNDNRFQDKKYYFNADMMNAFGRKEFTRVLIQDIKELNY